MITPIMIDRIGWGTYLFFAVVNACFLPFIYLFYPETARRSLEEIDIIFAKGYVEGKSYVQAAKELPLLTDEQVEQEAIRYGLIDSAARGGLGGKDALVGDVEGAEKSAVGAESGESGNGFKQD